MAIAVARQSLPTPSPMVATLPTLPSVESMLFDLEVEEFLHSERKSKQVTARVAKLKERLSYLTTPSSLFESRLLRDVKFFKQQILVEEGKYDNVVLASKLANIGYRVRIRTALGGGHGTDCFHNLHHLFLMVYGEGDYDGVEFIVEPHFRDQFHIPHPTELYSSILSTVVPEEFVGTASKLAPLVHAVCAEMQSAFESKGLTCPPWRQSKSMVSKWLPAKVKDITVSQASFGRTPSSASHSDTEDANLLEVSSPTSPLNTLPTFGPSATNSSKPQSSTVGFKAKSLLSSGLAATSNIPANPPKSVSRSQSNGHAGSWNDWQQRPIRTVKLTGHHN